MKENTYSKEKIIKEIMPYNNPCAVLNLSKEFDEYKKKAYNFKNLMLRTKQAINEIEDIISKLNNNDMRYIEKDELIKILKH